MDKIKIFLTRGSGEGVTEESAYCQALRKAGLINLNLIRLSSVLPHHCKIVDKKPTFFYKDYGKKLYVIISEARISPPSKSICAGLGWMLEARGTGNGLVIQTEGESENEVRRRIKDSLEEVAKRSKEKYKKARIVTEEIICRNKPVCVLVALVFKLEEWL